MFNKLIERLDRPFTRLRRLTRPDAPILPAPDWLIDRLKLTGPQLEAFNRTYGRRDEQWLFETLRHDRRGRPYVQEAIRSGPNFCHAQVIHPDGTRRNLGLSQNLLTNIGRDWWAQQWGKIPAGGQGTPATATSATSLTGTGTPWTASNLATPQLGLAGLRVVAPVTGITTAPVYGNIVSNSTSVLTLDQWWTGADGVGTTPASTNSFQIMPGGAAALRFVALSTNASAASASDTTLASEVTTNSGGRALATYTHTYGASTLTLTYTWTFSGTVTGIHKVGANVCLTSAGADPLIYETVLNADATVASGDQLALTWTFTLSG